MSDESRENDALAIVLAAGLGGGLEPARRLMGLPDDAPDDDVARTLVRAVTERALMRVRVHESQRGDPREARLPEPVGGADVSFLGRLGSKGRTVAEIDDLSTLIAVLRAGTLAQRRAAVRRVLERIEQGRGFSSDQLKRAIDALTSSRDVEIAYEIGLARRALSDAIGRSEIDDEDAIRAREHDVATAVEAYWDGERTEDPIAELAGDDRAHLLLRLRELPDGVASHVACVIEGADGSASREFRFELLSSVVYAGDPRLLPALRVVLEGDVPELAPNAARALGRIEDPRARAALLAAYERSVIDRERAVIAGALGNTGDQRGLSYVRKVLNSDDSAVVLAALEALESLGSAEDFDRVARFLEREDVLIATQAVRTLGRVADARALSALAKLREKTAVSALQAEIEDAVSSIRQRMELRGEETGTTLSSRRFASVPAPPKDAAPIATRFSSMKDYLVGQLWLAFGAIERAVGRFESAARKRRGWAAPLVHLAMAHLRREEHAQALAAFRRAIEAERGWVERDGRVARAIARCFLRRAEEMQRDGRVEIARGLLEEVLALDLRRAPSALQFEIRRRHEALRLASRPVAQ